MLYEKNVATRFGTIYYLESKTEGIPLLSLHGWFGKPDLAVLLDNYLGKKGYKIVAPYLPGHGKSFRIGEKFHYSNLLSSTKEFIYLTCPNSSLIFGHSLGGRLALDIAVVKKSDIRKIILYSPLLQLDKKSFKQTAFNIFVDFTLDNLKSVLNIPSNIHFYGPQYRNLAKMWSVVKNINRIEKIPDKKTQTLFLWGKNDRVLPLEKSLSYINGFNNKETRTFDGGHYCHKRDPDKFFKTIEEYVKE